MSIESPDGDEGHAKSGSGEFLHLRACPFFALLTRRDYSAYRVTRGQHHPPVVHLAKHRISSIQCHALHERPTARRTHLSFSRMGYLPATLPANLLHSTHHPFSINSQPGV